MEAAKVAAAIGNFQVNAQLPNGRSISFSMYVLEGEDLASINAKADLCQSAIERQRNRCEIPELEGKREQMIVALDQNRAVLAELEEKSRTSSLSSQERMNLKNLRLSLGRLDEEIKKGDAAIEAAKQKAGVGA